MSEFDYDAIRNGIAATAGEPAMVTNYAVIACVVDADGEETIQTISDCDHAWQVLGLLHHALLVTEGEKYGDDQEDV